MKEREGSPFQVFLSFSSRNLSRMFYISSPPTCLSLFLFLFRSLASRDELGGDQVSIATARPTPSKPREARNE